MSAQAISAVKPRKAAKPAKAVKARKNSRNPMDQLSVGEKVFNVCNTIFMVFMAFICFYPFWYIFINTISNNKLSADGEVLFWPKGIHFDNYKTIFELPGIANATVISVLRTVIGTVLCVAVSAFLGFMMTQTKMAHRQFIYRFFVATMYVNAGLIPGYILFNYLGLLDNFLVYVIPGAVSAFNIVLVKTYVESSIPASLQEAAEIDGAGTWTVFFRIALPLMGPILATLAIFSAVGQWNSFMDTVLYITNDKLQTLQYVLYRYLSQAQAMANIMAQNGGGADMAATGVTTQSIKLTVTMVTVLPIFIVYPFMQKYFVKGITIGAVKG
ncbi:carbohydrate ABC transporter permease [Bifidobacterium amazonense]|uniref:Carbohydrate ABC transporter permease n=1 Tax=Bifidobacterium amazonense TaxID=2809027 RepID=A0ABS9VV44_9BIFI|nr:carbohydrate ABC transporter permease [Bifidobacterium amazonense]MCH9275984.1 carbohydrate ABC transporter permease [Bifidobacterium amazonense]